MYILLASAALFALVARRGERFHPAIQAACVVLPIYLLRIITAWIPYGIEAAFMQYASASQLLVLVLQYVVAVFVFGKILHHSEDIPSYLGWVAVGWPVIFLLVPWLVGLVA